MAHLGQRLMTSINAGWRAAYNTYNGYNAKNHVAEIEFDFTAYDSRLARYWHNRRTVDNTIYHTIINAYANVYKNTENLYRFIRGEYNPVPRLVNLEVANTFGGVIDFENFEMGAIPINGADETLLESIRQVLKWSNIQQLKRLYPREGATMGDIALKVIDDPERGKVRLEVLDPRKVYDVELDAVGNVKMIDIRYDEFDRDTDKWFEYRETINKDSFCIYHGNDVHDEWDNPYGFVPIEWTPHVNTAFGFGVTSFHHVRYKIDNMNDMATLLHDNMRKVVNTKFQYTGSSDFARDSTGKPETISVTTDNRDTAPILRAGDGEFKPMISPLDLDGALAVLINLGGEIEKDLPQLSLQTMRNNNPDLSGIAIKHLYSDALELIGETQGNYIQGLKSAVQMAVSVGAFRRYDGFKRYNVDSFHNGDLDFNIERKVLFGDELSKKETLELTLQALDSKAPQLLMEKLGYNEDEILAAKRENMRSQARSTRRNPITVNTGQNDTEADAVEPQDTEQVVPIGAVA